MFCSILPYMAVLQKWVIVGRYRPCALARYSMAFYRWWLVDRIVELYEGWAGIWFGETIICNYYMWLFGSKVHMSANIAVSYRECDLVTVGDDADIQAAIIPRLVTPDGVVMHRIHIGHACKIDAAIPPNVVVEDGATVDFFAKLACGSRVVTERKRKVSSYAVNVF